MSALHETIYGFPATSEALTAARASVVEATRALGLVASLRALADATAGGFGPIIAEAANRIEDGSRGRTEEREAAKRAAEEEARKPLPRFQRLDGDALRLVTKDGDGRVVRLDVNLSAPWRVSLNGRGLAVVEVTTQDGSRWSVPAETAADCATEPGAWLDDQGPTVEAGEELEPLYRLLARSTWMAL